MKYLLYLSFFALTTIFIACEEDDDDGIALVYEVCDVSLTFSENEKRILKEYTIAEIPNTIRSYVAAEFPGYAISTATSFEVNDGIQYIQVGIGNNGQLLFDNEGIFLCGEEGISAGGYGDEYDDEEYINSSDLPQVILDYIAQNYPNASIEEVELEDGEYEIELSNDVDLCFDLQGNYLGKDC